MRPGIHPEYKAARITCACGRVSETFATVDELHVEICSHCHPFFTGRQKLVDTAGRVERFRRKYGTGESRSARAARAKESAEDDSAVALAAEADSPTEVEEESPVPPEDVAAEKTAASAD